MAILLDKQGTQHYANKMVLGENRKVNGKPLTSALTEIDTKLTEMKGLFDQEYGTALDMTLENTDVSSFKVGTGSGVDRSGDVVNSFTDLTIKGKTLQNLVIGGKTEKELGRSGATKAKYKLNTNIMDYPRKDYSIIFTLSGLISTPPPAFTISINSGQLATISIREISNGICVAKIPVVQNTTPNELWIYHNTTDLGVIGKVKDVMILEGDWTNKEIPPYFEGIQSAYEDNKIKILSHGKNLCDIEDGGIDIVGRDEVKTFAKRSKNYINVPGTYTLSSKSNGWYGIYFYDLSGNFKNFIRPSTTLYSLTFTIATNEQVRVGSWRDGDANQILQIEEGTNATPFEPYICDKKEILLPCPHREWNNYNSETGEYTDYSVDLTIDSCPGSGITQDGKFAWKRIDELIPFQSFIDSFSLDKLYIANHNKNDDNIQLVSSNSNGIWVVIPKRLLQTIDVTGFDNYLKSNPRRIVYKRATPIVHKIEKMPLLKSCDDITHVSQENNKNVKSSNSIRIFKNGHISTETNIAPSSITHTVALNKTAQIKKNIEELTVLKNRVEEMERVYDQATLEQTHKLELLAQNFELDNI